MVRFEWNEANIIALFKKGSRNKSENLTSVIYKLLERLIKDHMVDFLIRHKLLNPSQHGFLKARSCLTNMLCFLEEITKWIDEGSPVDIIYLDFLKAFDKVPQQRLLLKLKAHGIGDGIIDWIEQWLTDRRQHVVVDNIISKYNKQHHMMYADDLCVFSPSVAGLRKLTDCCAKYGNMFEITYNAKKSVCMVIDNKPRDKKNIHPVVINNHTLPYTEKCKYLGHIINNNLTDDDDIARQKRCIYAQANALARKFYLCNNSIKTTLFNSYCGSMYTSHLKSLVSF